MLTRKELKKKGKRSLKEHYWIFVAVCLIASFISAEFSDSLTFSSLQTPGTGAAAEAEGGSPEDLGTSDRKVEFTDVLVDLFMGDLEGGKEKSQERLQEEQEKGTAVLGRTQGVLAKFVNLITSGSIVVTVVAAVASVTGSESLGLVLVILAGLLFFFAFWYLLQNVYVVISRRIFLEGRCYEKVPLQRFAYLFRIRRWLKTARTMFVTWLFQFLWTFTILGGVIKHYSYFMVPYLVAENPDIPTRQAIRLSRRMMKGHKWQCFVMELSFLGWDLLGVVTLGLSNVFYRNPYQAAAFSEYYVELRRLAKEAGLEGAEFLNDRYLFEPPALEVIREAYQDVLAVMEAPKATLDHLTGWRGFLAKNFGVLIFRTQRERAYEESQAARVRVESLAEAAAGRVYPTRLYPIPEEQRRAMVETIHYIRHYTVWSLVIQFFLFSFIGWLWEVSLHLITDGVFVNRGVLHGPWLPIYGTGGVLILTLLNRFRRHPLAEFTATVVMCGTLEYFTSYFMELMTGGTRWWDYSGYFLNLHGRICAEGLLVFGVGGMAIVYLLAPMLDNLIQKIPEKALAVLCAALLVAFAADALYSQKHPNTGEGITARADIPAWETALLGREETGETAFLRREGTGETALFGRKETGQEVPRRKNA